MKPPAPANPRARPRKALGLFIRPLISGTLASCR
jgi:hypothetical protein